MVQVRLGPEPDEGQGCRGQVINALHRSEPAGRTLNRVKPWYSCQTSAAVHNLNERTITTWWGRTLTERLPVGVTHAPYSQSLTFALVRAALSATVSLRIVIVSPLSVYFCEHICDCVHGCHAARLAAYPPACLAVEEGHNVWVSHSDEAWVPGVVVGKVCVHDCRLIRLRTPCGRRAATPDKHHDAGADA